MYDASNSEEAMNTDFDDSRTMKSEMEDDDDKVMYPKIGKTEITIDKVLSNLLVSDEFPCYRNIYSQDPDANFSEDDENFSQMVSQSNKNQVLPEIRNLMQTKGRVHLVFTAELTEEFAARTEKIKKTYIIDTLKKVAQLDDAIKNKRVTLHQAVECLYHIQFEIERGLILDQLTSVMDDGSSQMTDLSHMTLDKVYKSGNVNSSKQSNKDDVRKLRQKNQKEIEQFERDNQNAMNKGTNNRLCGCEANCNIF